MTSSTRPARDTQLVKDRRLAAVALVVLLAFMLLLVRPPAAQAAFACSPCHDRLLPAWSGSRHELAGRQVKGGFRCQECHAGGLLHPGGVTSGNSVDRCGRCHWSDSKDRRSGPQPVTALSRAEWVKSPHAQAKVNCTGCHSVHHYAEGADQQLLRLAGDGLCLSCHPRPKHEASTANQAALAKQPCVSCHNPHGPETGLLPSQAGGGKRDFQKAFVHRPVAEQKCNDCHTAHLVATAATPPEDDEEDTEPTGPKRSGAAFRGLLLRPGRDFCYLCHDSFRQKFEASGHARILRFKQGDEQSACLGCHLPHASDYRKLLRYEGNQLCISCHPGYAPHHFLARGGVKQSQLQCVKCHLPHGSGNRRLLVQEEICRMCHKM